MGRVGIAALRIALLCGGGIASFPGTALGQSAPDAGTPQSSPAPAPVPTAGTPNTDDDIVVTATRTGAVSVQKVPLAISVVDPAALNRQGGQGFTDYLGTLPSVFVQSLGPGQNKINIRGFSTGTFAPTDTQDRTLVAVYLDDTPISLQGNTPDLKVFDLERVEVLRGPQGTLFGASAMAGTVRFITKKPNLTKTEGNIEGQLSGTEDGGLNWSLRGSISVPLVTDRVALRVGGYQGRNSGYIDNVGTGRKDANYDETTQLRAVLRIKATDRLTLDPSFTYSRLRTGGEPTVLVGVAGVGPGQYRSTVDEFYRDNLKLYNLTANYELDGANIVSSTSYIDRSFARHYGGEYLVQRLGLRRVVPAIQPFDLIAPNDIASTVRDFTQELRINSTGERRFNWIGGVFYQNQRRSLTQNIFAKSLSGVGFDQLRARAGGNGVGVLIPSTSYGAPFSDMPFYGDQHYSERQIALFGELSYLIVPGLKATIGARYFDWRQNFDLYYGGLLGAVGVGQPLRRTDSAKEHGVNPRFALSYQANDNILFFAEAAKGFRFGGVNDPLPTSCGATGGATFGPDKTWSYSLGAKTQLFDRHLKLNVTAFRADWNDIQTLFVITACSYGIKVNAGNVRNQGVELETTLRVTDNIALTFNGSYTDAKANGNVINVNALDGARAPYVPKFSATTAIDLNFPVASRSSINIHGQYEHKSGYYNSFTPQITPSVNLFRFPESNLFSASVNYVSGTWEAGVFGRNLSDERTIVGRSGNNNFGFRNSIARGRTIGARLAYKF